MTRQTLVASAAAIVLVGSIVTFALLFLTTLDRAGRLFDRAALSQAQAADVLEILAAARSDDAARLAAAIARHRTNVARETALVGDHSRAGQARELIEAEAVATLASAGPSRLVPLARKVAAAAARERGEAGEIAERMAALRVRARTYAVLLALAALGSAGLGAFGLAAANRRLAGAVAARTAQLVAVDASRRLFFAKVSHELRTPVTVMRGEAEVALATTDGDPAPLADALGEVIVQAQQLDRRVSELLALSQAEEGRLVLAREPVELAAVLARVVEQGRRHARSNAVTLRTELAPARVEGDARWLEQAMTAVLDNAIKFSPEGGVVDVSLAPAPGGVAVTVADRGVGVLPQTLPRLFDAYYQTDEGRARGGSGLGLALVRWVVEQHRGTARAKARAGGGCAITLSFPVAA